MLKAIGVVFFVIAAILFVSGLLTLSYYETKFD